jgi:hypothetical protein
MRWAMAAFYLVAGIVHLIAADAKPGNGVLGPIFIGMVMRRVVVMVGPITRATRRP